MWRSVLLSVVAGTAVMAVEEDPIRLVFQDLRLQVGPALSSAHARLSRDGAEISEGEVTWDSTGRWAVQWLPPIAQAADDGAGMAIIEVHSDRVVSADAPATGRLVQRAVLADLHLGLAWLLWARTTVELSGFGGLGTTWQEGGSDRGSAWEVGARLGVTWAPVRTGWGSPLVGAAVLTSYGSWQGTVALADRTYDLDLIMSGWAPAAVVGWRF